MTEAPQPARAPEGPAQAAAVPAPEPDVTARPAPAKDTPDKQTPGQEVPAPAAPEQAEPPQAGPEQPEQVIPPLDPEAVVRLRPAPPRTVRLSRRAVIGLSASALTLVAIVLVYGLHSGGPVTGPELVNTGANTVSDKIATGPKDYTQVPRLGPPLPGDLGRPILAAQNHGAVAALPQTPAPPHVDPVRQRAAQELDAARASRVFFAGGQGPGTGLAGAAGTSPALPTVTGPPVPSAAADSSNTARQQAFLSRAADQHTASTERLSGPTTPNTIQAGSVIPAALVTGIRSDLPGLVTAQVTENVYDSLTGRVLLIPQGSRLIGDYDAEVTFGQNRVLLAWTRLILTDGRSLVLERQPATDAAGHAGLEDRTNYHWGGVFKAALLSSVLGIGAELGSGNDSAIVAALRRGSQDSIARAGDQVVSRELSVKPTLTIRPGYPVRVLVTRDLIVDAVGAP